MDEYEDLYSYNGDTIHDMYVDNDYNINTSELDDLNDNNSIEETYNP